MSKKNFLISYRYCSCVFFFFKIKKNSLYDQVLELTVWHNIYLKMISWHTAAHWPYVEAPFPFYLVFYDPALRPAAGVRLPLTRPGHRPPVGGAKPQRAAANGNRAGGSRSPGIGSC